MGLLRPVSQDGRDGQRGVVARLPEDHEVVPREQGPPHVEAPTFDGVGQEAVRGEVQGSAHAHGVVVRPLRILEEEFQGPLGLLGRVPVGQALAGPLARLPRFLCGLEHGVEVQTRDARLRRRRNQEGRLDEAPVHLGRPGQRRKCEGHAESRCKETRQTSHDHSGSV